MWNLLAVLQILVLYVILTLEQSCPANPQSEISTCLTNMGLNPEMAGGSTLVTDTDRAKKVCNDGTLDEAIRCMENVFTACIQHKQTSSLEKLVNIERWRTGMNLLCDNINALIINDKCIRDANAQSLVCVNRESTEFRSKLKVKVMGGETSPDEIMTFSCIFADRIVECMRSPLSYYCPADVRDVMTGVVQSFMPPICDPYWGSATSNSDVPKISFFAIFVSCAVLVIFC
ncbi:hypothetical protein SNE40_015767 [Patella caerulea]|uniref:Uncharacterized protein n=1 Tax=Patella caerulea TaxID=87958 RepID=A0AAN8JI13_PATCE